MSYATKWLGHIKEHYFDSKLVKNEWIAQKIVNFNYDSVIFEMDQGDGKGEYRPLTEVESRVYAKAWNRMRITEDEFNKRSNK